MSNENPLQHILQKYFKTHTMKIEPCYVEFSQAKLLKEKGFDEKCETYFTVKQVIMEHYGIKVKNTTYTHDEISRPEQHIVTEFFRVVHGIWITVDININGFFANTIREWNKKDNAWEVRSIDHVKKHITPQEAYSAAISYCLENII